MKFKRRGLRISYALFVFVSLDIFSRTNKRFASRHFLNTLRETRRTDRIGAIRKRVQNIRETIEGSSVRGINYFREMCANVSSVRGTMIEISFVHV